MITILVCLSVSLTLWLWEQEKSLCWLWVQHSTWTAGVPCHPEQWKTVSVVDIQKKSMVLTGKDDEEKLNNMFSRPPTGTVLRLKQSQLCPGNEVITFFCFCRLSHLILQDLSCLTNVFWVDERFAQVFAHLSSTYCWKMINRAFATIIVSGSGFKFRIWDPICECV